MIPKIGDFDGQKLALKFEAAGRLHVGTCLNKNRKDVVIREIGDVIATMQVVGSMNFIGDTHMGVGLNQKLDNGDVRGVPDPREGARRPCRLPVGACQRRGAQPQ